MLPSETKVPWWKIPTVPSSITQSKSPWILRIKPVCDFSSHQVARLPRLKYGTKWDLCGAMSVWDLYKSSLLLWSRNVSYMTPIHWWKDEKLSVVNWKSRWEFVTPLPPNKLKKSKRNGWWLCFVDWWFFWLFVLSWNYFSFFMSSSLESSWCKSLTNALRKLIYRKNYCRVSK